MNIIDTFKEYYGNILEKGYHKDKVCTDHWETLQ